MQSIAKATVEAAHGVQPTVTLIKPNTFNERNGRRWKRGVPQPMTADEATGYLDNPRFRVRGLAGVASFMPIHDKRPKASMDVMLDIQQLVEDMKLDDSPYKEDPANYTANGEPNWHAIKTHLGYDVTAEEVAKVIAGWEPSEAEERDHDIAQKKAAKSDDMLAERGDMTLRDVRDPPPRPKRGGLTIVNSRSAARRKKFEKVSEMNTVGAAGIGTTKNEELVSQVGGDDMDLTQVGAVGLDGGN